MAKIAEERRRENNGTERQRLQDELDALEAKINDRTTKSYEYSEEIKKITYKLKAKENEEKGKRSRRDELRHAQMDTKQTLHTLNASKTSALKVYHDKMADVVAEIERRRQKFKEMPIGPLGAYVKILKEEWVHICENIFGKSLNGFLVTNHDDRMALQEILDNKKWYVKRPQLFLMQAMFQ